ncbi:TPA: GntR family transcriptional regulator [Klebsiella pneumoniae]|uniref:GntR family transcriptional regulator n=1 Tax=Klebsiella pneumoniae TaxID=573 RepID=UPI000E2D5519|nr:GntR family transcriptional regulator [Klebsiella pneumoniae]AYK02200.1 FCD domain-containing protein [Klebsiella pneumoniae]TYW59248.1 GntR family transcriptional regulator [Klebsiella pneumoniae]WLX55095.1 GntR family transcriptional regulator [Klebsiella pneumoniae]SWP98251.1 transcriptional regulator [Klebsiella pneumoniae]VVL12177.1 L-lactate utilization operon repressor [Klebsiella pneumoniae]
MKIKDDNEAVRSEQKRMQWTPLRARTLVDDAVDAIVAAAARGMLLPGDRIVETDIASKLNISRIPVREALRLLESQGIVVSEPFKGIRLAPVSKERLENIFEVRVTLELLAVKRIVTSGLHKEALFLDTLRQCIDEMQIMSMRKDAYGVANADVAFHRELCRLSGNDVLLHLWEGVARQLTIVVGLSTLEKSMHIIVDEHNELSRVLASGDLPKIEKCMINHIIKQNKNIDFSALAERKTTKKA